MTDLIEFDPVDDIAAGAFGRPGARTFVIQARKGAAVLSVLVEKEQVRLLAAEATQFLDRIAEEEPGGAGDRASRSTAARCAKPSRCSGPGSSASATTPTAGSCSSSCARTRPTRTTRTAARRPTKPKAASRASTRRAAQIRTMMRNGVAAVEGGRPPCPLCDFPMNPDGHICPRWN